MDRSRQPGSALSSALFDRLAAEAGLFHRGSGGERLQKSLGNGALRALHEALSPGMRTLETGCGGSTVVFAAAGARHTAVTPLADEERRVRELCAREGVSLGSVDFAIRSSDEFLPGWREPLDAVLIDGAHRMPFPFLDWHYAARRLKVGGTLWVDDISIPSVFRLFEFLRGELDWRLVAIHDDKLAQFEKVADPRLDPVRDSELQAYNRFWKRRVSHIPLRRRWRRLPQRVMLRARLASWFAARRVRRQQPGAAARRRSRRSRTRR